MASLNQEWKDCGKHISEYTLIKLPRGNEDSHSDFYVGQYKKKAGQYNKSEKKKLEEAQEELLRKEQKILGSDVE